MNGKPGSPSLLLRFFDSFLQERSIRWLLALGMLILLGSSLLVHPAAALPMIAKSNGAALAIVNREPTAVDGTALRE